MIRSALPIMHLAEPAARRTTRTQGSGFDFAFVFLVALVLVGGCFFMLDMAAARSHGQGSATVKVVSESVNWLPVLTGMAMALGKYALLFLASVVNSALIVLLVQSLRKLDGKLSRLTPRFSLNGWGSSPKVQNIRGKRAHLESQRAGKRREASAIRESSPFLLSPVFR